MSHLPGAPQATATRPVASLDRRFQAFAIDRLLEAAVIALAGLVTWWLVGEAWPVVWACLGAGGALWLTMAVVLGVSGTSVGKRAVGVRVVHHGSGTPIGVGAALVRSLVLLVSGIPTFGIGLATLAWTAVEDRGRERRGLHDHWASSVVVDEQPVAAHAGPEVDDQPRHVVNLTALRLVPAPAPAPVQPAPAPIQPAPPRPAPASPPMSPPPQVTRTQWRADFDDGRSFVIVGTVLVGRRPEPRTGEVVAHVVGLSSADLSMSKTHAQFGPVSDGGLVVMDRGSTNGTLVVRRGAARRLSPGRPATLLDGDEIVLGDRKVIVRREA